MKGFQFGCIFHSLQIEWSFSFSESELWSSGDRFSSVTAEASRFIGGALWLNPRVHASPCLYCTSWLLVHAPCTRSSPLWRSLNSTVYSRKIILGFGIYFRHRRRSITKTAIQRVSWFHLSFIIAAQASSVVYWLAIVSKFDEKYQL